LQGLYQQIRDHRNNQEYNEVLLQSIFEDVKTNHTKDWLLTLEILELVNAQSNDSAFASQLRLNLTSLKSLSAEHDKLITDGLKLVDINMALLQQV
jgi:phenylalanine-4-hydroxylase